MINNYTRTGCEYECAVAKAVELCQCLPWYITSNFTDITMCDMFGGHCFQHVISDVSSYKKCPDLCVEDCKGTPLTIVTSYLPINTNVACKKGGFLHEHFLAYSRQHFAFDNYKSLINGDGEIPNLGKSLANGSLCSSYVRNFVVYG